MPRYKLTYDVHFKRTTYVADAENEEDAKAVLDDLDFEELIENFEDLDITVTKTEIVKASEKAADSIFNQSVDTLGRKQALEPEFDPDE